MHFGGQEILTTPGKTSQSDIIKFLLLETTSRVKLALNDKIVADMMIPLGFYEKY